MSVEAYKAVWDHFGGSDRQFVLMLASANRADEHGILWTSTKWYIEKTRWPRSKVYEVLAELDKADKLVIVDSAQGRGHVTIRWIKLPDLDGDLAEAEEVLRKKGLISRTLSGGSDEGSKKGPGTRTLSHEKGSEHSDEKGPNTRTKRVRDLGRPYIEEKSVETSVETSCVATHDERRKRLLPASLIDPLRRAAEAKDGVLDPEALLRACRSFEDRDLIAEAEKFASWHLHGNGKNAPLRDCAQGFRGWLERAPVKRGAQSIASLMAAEAKAAPPEGRGKVVESKSASEAWAEAKGRLRGSVSNTTYELWIAPFEVAGVRDGGVLVLVDSSEHGGLASWTQTRYASLFLEALDDKFTSVEIVDETQLEYEAR
jgi:hypothetical protein